MRRFGSWILVALLGLVGCGGSNTMNTNPVGGGGPGGSGGSAGDGQDAGENGPPGLPGAQYGTYIALGDSISDQGGIGPFFYDLLFKNDDATYPAFAGHDLSTKYPGIMMVHAAKAGSVVIHYSDGTGAMSPTLKDQIAGLGSSYPGDVLVTVTIGGNDLNGHATDAIVGTDATARMEFQQNLTAELSELTKPGRLGQGKVYVLVTNIYDFTDGMGDFLTVNCGPSVNISGSYDQMAFGNWNGVMSQSAQTAGASLFDMHAFFTGHGYNNKDATQVWFAGGDSVLCIHPDAAGHDAIRRGVWKMVTGEAL